MSDNQLPPYTIPPRESLCNDMGDDGFGYYTKAMFINHNSPTARTQYKIKPTFTIREYDHDGCYSFYKLFMQYDSDYEAAIGILGSWSHFQTLLKAEWFRNKYEKWVEEREIRDRAKTKAMYLNQIKSGNVAAAKAIDDLYKRQGAGRPSKKEKETEARKAAAVNGKVASILDRMES